MFSRDKIIDTLHKKIVHAKGIDRDFVYLPVWQAKELVEFLQPMKPRQTISGCICDRCGHQIRGEQNHCDNCGQRIV